MVIERIREIRNRGTERLQRILHPSRLRQSEIPTSQQTIMNPLTGGDERRMNRWSMIPSEGLVTADKRPEAEKVSVQYVVDQNMANPKKDGRVKKAAQQLIKEHVQTRSQWLATHDPSKPSLGRALTGIAEFTPLPLSLIVTGVAPEATAALAAIPGAGWLLLAALTAYTVGDVLTGAEMIRGKTLDGRPLSLLEKAIYGVATAIPGLPARPFITWLDKQQQKHLDPRLKQASTKTQNTV